MCDLLSGKTRCLPGVVVNVWKDGHYTIRFDDPEVRGADPASNEKGEAVVQRTHIFSLFCVPEAEPDDDPLDSSPGVEELREELAREREARGAAATGHHPQGLPTDGGRLGGLGTRLV